MRGTLAFVALVAMSTANGASVLASTRLASPFAALSAAIPGAESLDGAGIEFALLPGAVGAADCACIGE